MVSTSRMSASRSSSRCSSSDDPGYDDQHISNHAHSHEGSRGHLESQCEVIELGTKVGQIDSANTKSGHSHEDIDSSSLSHPHKENTSHGHSHGLVSHSDDEEIGPERCTVDHYDQGHKHGPNCGHLAIFHVDKASNTYHVGFIVKGEFVCFNSIKEVDVAFWRNEDGRTLVRAKACSLSTVFPMMHHADDDNSKQATSSTDPEAALAHVSHAGHRDVLVNDNSGNVVMRSLDTGHVHGVMFRHDQTASWWSDLLFAPGIRPVFINTSEILEDMCSTVKSVLSVKGVCCKSEVPSVVACCMQVEGANQVQVSILTQRIYLMHDANAHLVPEQVARKLNESGFPSQVLRNGSEEVRPEIKIALIDSGPQQSHENSTLKWNILVACIFWLLSWLEYVKLPEHLADSSYLHWLAIAFGSNTDDGNVRLSKFKYFGLIAVALAFPKIALKGFHAMRRQVIDVNVLMSFAVVGAIVLGDINEAATVVVIFSLSDWLGDRASEKARMALKTLMEMKPELARDAHTNSLIPVEDVQVGQILVVLAADKVPVDGIFLSPTECELDESTLTGESKPVVKRQGDFVHAGTLNVTAGFFQMQCTSLAKDSAVARMIRMVEASTALRSPTEMLVDKIARIYTPFMIVLAITLSTIPWAWGPDVGHQWLKVSLTLLVVACPCALVISTPITYCCALAQAARFGVLVKGGKYFEILANVNCVCSDKTGTLTKGEFTVNELCFVEFANADLYEGGFIDQGKRSLLGLLNMIEEKGIHPVSKAIAKFCIPFKVDCEFDIAQLQIIPGAGAQALLVGRMYSSNKVLAVMVSENYRKKNFPSNSEPEEAILSEFVLSQQGRMVSWLILDGKVVVGVSASDDIRPEAQECVDQLRSLHVSMVVLTGDNEGAAKLLQSRLKGLESMYSGLQPEDKVERVRALQISGRTVCVLGDGCNDAPAFSVANVGIAMAYGAPLALETADCALLDNDLRKLPRLLRLARRTRRTIIQNLAFSFASKLVVLVLTFTGHMTLGLAVATDVGAMLLVTLNGVALLGMNSSTVVTPIVA